VRIVIAGSGGLIGTALRDAYQRDGHTVVRLVRREPAASDEVRWHHTSADPRPLDGADVLVNLAGAPLGDKRWSHEYREVIRHSRIATAHALGAAVARAASPPRVVLSASGIRFYGIDRGDEVLTESSGPGGEGLLPSVAQEWEAATQPASDAGIAVCHLRLGLVLSRRGGLLPPLLRTCRAGVGMYFGSGREFWSFVSLEDTVRAIRFLADSPAASGAYNISTPEPARNEEFTRTLARIAGARLVLRMPLPLLGIALGGIATEVFGGLRVVPARLQEAGFRFEHPSAESALRAAVAP
jgi:uncharacterized protein (TIGR01777 family)